MRVRDAARAAGHAEEARRASALVERWRGEVHAVVTQRQDAERRLKDRDKALRDKALARRKRSHVPASPKEPSAKESNREPARELARAATAHRPAPAPAHIAPREEDEDEYEYESERVDDAADDTELGAARAAIRAMFNYDPAAHARAERDGTAPDVEVAGFDCVEEEERRARVRGREEDRREEEARRERKRFRAKHRARAAAAAGC